RVHVGPEPDRRPLSLALDDRDDARRRNALVDLVHAECAEPLGDEGRGLVAREAEFRVLMQVPPPGGHLGGEVGDSVQDGHVDSQGGLAISRKRTAKPGALQWPRPATPPTVPPPTVSSMTPRAGSTGWWRSWRGSGTRRPAAPGTWSRTSPPSRP